MSKIKLGVEARDIVTGFQGIVTGELKRLSGQHQFELQKQISEDNKYPPSAWVDEPYVAFVAEGVHVEPQTKEFGFRAGEKK